MVEYKNLLIEKDGKIVVISINRPRELNALNEDTVLELDKAFLDIQADNSISAVILTGSGEKAFVAGADITEMVAMASVEARNWSRLGQQVFSKIEKFPKPVIAAINGFALGGGCELAMSCDIRVAAENAKFGQPEVNLGIIPGFAGTQRLSRLVGKGRAKLLIYTGDVIDVKEAYRIGLVDMVVPSEELLSSSKKLAQKITSKAQVAVNQAKIVINTGLDMDMESANVLEAEMFALCFSTLDQTEGMQAFKEKRKPIFTGR
jgi:enoyl-CoA hydratase